LKSQRGSGGKARASKERHSRHGSGFFRRMDKNDVDLPMPDGVVAKTRALMHEVYAEAGLAKTGHGPGFFGL